MDKNRVVITGMGAVTPVGIGLEPTWQALLAGRSGIRRITRFDPTDCPTQIGGEVLDFDPVKYMDFKDAKRTARFTQFAIAATKEALQAAQLDLSKVDLTRTGISLGTAIGGADLIEEQTIVFQQHGLRRINPVLVPILLPSAGACQLAILFGIKGPTHAPVAACATGTVAIGDALRDLQYGDADVMIAGGAESAMSALDIGAFSRIGALSTRNDAPEAALRPFDARRDGTVISEGAAVVIMETLQHARSRGAPVLAEVLGYALTEDAYHLAAPEPSGEGAARAMARALAEAGIATTALDLIVPHGTGTPLNDVVETRACRLVFGEHAHRIAISAVKSMLGHMFGAAGSISVAAGVLAIRDGVVPPTINLEYPDPECDLDYVPNHARTMRVDTAMANAFGFGGQNATVVVRRYDPD
jgi:3-oxoacyl-[acyl-carrier-protein] synthase II